MAMLNPALELWLIATLAVLVAFISASQDVVIDAYRTEILTPEERSSGMALFVSFYRIAFVISSAGALIIADHAGWTFTYLFMACLLIIGIVATFLAQEPPCTALSAHRSLRDSIVLPLQDFWQRDKALWLLLLIVFYKLADAFTLQLMTAFFTGGADIQGLGFSKTEVGLIGNGWGVAATLLGASVSAILMVRLSLFAGLLIFGFFQAASNLMFYWLAIVDKNYTLLVATVFIENFCSALGTIAFTTLLMGLCNPLFAVAQYAILSAFAAIGTRFLGPLAGWMVAEFGWAEFYIWSFIAGAPGLVLVVFLRKTLGKYNNH